MDNFKIYITEDEWIRFPKEKRERLKKIMAEKYDWDVSELEEIEREHEERMKRYKDKRIPKWRIQKEDEEGED